MAINCPACECNDSFEKERVGRYRLFECRRCQLTFSDPMMSGDEKYYEGHIAIRHESREEVLANSMSFDTADNRRLLSSLEGDSRVLDVGCGVGGFVAFAVNNYGIDAFGIDFNSSQIALGRSVFGLGDRICVKSIEDLSKDGQDRKFDLITLFEVVEHVEQPKVLIENVFGLLKPGGMLVLSCPNEQRWQPAGRLFVDFPPYHLTRWTPRSMRCLLTSVGFREVDVLVSSSFRDILWTIYVNVAAKRRRGREENSDLLAARAEDGAAHANSGKGIKFKQLLFSLAGVLTAPFDLILKLFRIGTMGMRVMARKPG